MKKEIARFGQTTISIDVDKLIQQAFRGDQQAWVLLIAAVFLPPLQLPAQDRSDSGDPVQSA